MSSEVAEASGAVPEESVAPTTSSVKSPNTAAEEPASVAAPAPGKPVEATDGVTSSDKADNAAAADDDAAVDETSGASSKNKGGRRSSGIPEHKGKKLKKQKSMPNLNIDAKPGDYFFARLKGYAPWPGMIADEDILPEKMLSTRPVTAKNANGTYRADFDDGGKNVKDRTYPVLFLGTYEFAWMTNTDLTPMTPAELKEQGKPKKVSKNLSLAYDEAMEGHDLDHFKNKLSEFQRKIDEAFAEQQKAEEEKEAKKAQKEAEKAAAKAERAEKAAKRKSKDAATAGDAMDVDKVGGSESAKKPTKKRKTEEGAPDTEKPTKTPKKGKTLNLSQAANGESSSAKKTKKVAKPPKEPSPVLTAEEKFDKVRREVFYYRHKLQKGFLTRDTIPQETDMKQLAEYFTFLENYGDLDPKIIKETKIHKVLKGITRLQSIPKEAEFHFMDRSTALLARWGVESGSKEDSKNEEKKETAQTNGTTTKVEDKSEIEKVGEAAPEPKAENAMEVAAGVEKDTKTRDTGSAVTIFPDNVDLPMGEPKPDTSATETKPPGDAVPAAVPAST